MPQRGQFIGSLDKSRWASANPDVVFIPGHRAAPAVPLPLMAGQAGRLTLGWGLKLVALVSKLLSISDGDAWTMNSMLLQSYRLRVGTSEARMRNADCVDLMLKNGY